MKKKIRCRRALTVYAAAVVFCGVFSAVYEAFSHNVYSLWMILLFVYPLVLGVIPFLALTLCGGRRRPGRTEFNLYNAGVATLAVGSAAQGALEIYGTGSVLIIVYPIVGGALLIAAAVGYLKNIRNVK